jgi:hypothetical protein
MSFQGSPREWYSQCLFLPATTRDSMHGVLSARKPTQAVVSRVFLCLSPGHAVPGWLVSVSIPSVAQGPHHRSQYLHRLAGGPLAPAIYMPLRRGIPSAGKKGQTCLYRIALERRGALIGSSSCSPVL